MKYLPLLALAGCFGNTYTLHPDPVFSPDIVAATHAAAADWSAHVPVTFTFTDAPCSLPRKSTDMCLHAVASIPPVPWEKGDLKGYTILTEIWLVAPWMDGQSSAHLQRLIAHEMGHSMGLLDDPKPGALMYPYAGGAFTVTDRDVAQWKTVRESRDRYLTFPRGPLK